MSQDPFSYHPRLRALIADPEKSYFRNFDTEAFAAQLAARGIHDAVFPTDVREAGRRAFLDRYGDGDLWVFAYGSLMWDPGVVFAEVRRAYVPTHSRRFILRDIWGARGDGENPGLMAALAEGTGCDGLAFRIARDQIDQETPRLWARERVGPAYCESVLQTRLSDRTVDALAFVADYGSEAIQPDLTRDQQITYIATGTGFLGSSLDYIRNLAGQFSALEIEDTDLTGLLADAEARAASLSNIAE